MASGMWFDEDGRDVTMDVLSAAVDATDDEPRPCTYVIFYGSRDPDSPRFGQDETCEADALPGEGFCSAHLPFAELGGA